VREEDAGGREAGAHSTTPTYTAGKDSPAGEPSCETREEPGTLTQGGALFSLVPLAKPSTANVMDKYYELFRGQGGKGLERNEGMEEG
jgi:hypothetical protein